jgi:N-acyl-D-amino-acid deacylase
MRYRGLSLATFLVFCGWPALASGSDAIPTTGQAVEAFSALDTWMQSFMEEHKIPGGAAAIVRDGKLVYARGFGCSDRDAKEPVQPESLFRIASVSKPITAVAILRLAEQGKLKLADKVLDHLQYDPHFEEGGKFDERWRQVTIAHCLAHTGGWDRDKSYDPMFQAVRMARSLKIELPVLPEHIIRYQLGQPLDFDPGERYAYSNFGYSLLGRIIERVSGQPYEKFVQNELFKPLGITRARMGGSLANERADGEVRYYTVSSGQGTAVVGPGAGEAKVPIGYGTWRQETLDSHGGWIASAPDLARFAAACDLVDNGQRTRGALLKPETIALMLQPHAAVLSTDDKAKIVGHYGYGWTVKDESDAAGKSGIVARHGGALACTAASLMHFPDGTNVAVLFNLGQFPDGRFLGRHMEGPITKLIRDVKSWPTESQ